jgi:type II secretory ATPase GspE/PulE/Tfp pilus assembly ATPase PilB-like protein
MRLLDNAKAVQPIEQLILAEKVCRVVQKMITRPHGVIYVCGPTGSGKTTTLYSSLGMIKGEHINITTVEDPIEYAIAGIAQVNVKPEIGLTFASILRSILRQDPNVILVGETRDVETGKLVLEAGLTGHLVLTSLHTNDAIGTIERLREMGLENFAIAASLIGVVSQRLVRRLCPACAQEGKAAPQVLDQLIQADILPQDFQGPLNVAKGCDECEGSGFIGRVACYEILVADDELRQQIMENASQFSLRATALQGAYVPITRYANFLLTSGVTTGEELLGIIVGSG